MRNKTTATNRQRARLKELQEDSPAARDGRRRLMEWLESRRRVDRRCQCEHSGGHGTANLPPVDLIDWKGDGEVLPVVAGEMFVRTDSHTAEEFDAISRDLKALGWSNGGERDETPNVVLFRANGRDAATLKRALQILKDSKWRASPNHIMPLNWSVKGKEGPEITCEPLPGFEKPKKPWAQLIAVDTGLASCTDRDRNDGRLAAAGGDEDPLDEVDRDGNLLPDGCLDLGAGHGTSVAGVVESIHPDVTTKVLRALGPDGVGSETAIAEKIREAATELDRCGVINLSFGSQSYDDEPPIWLEAVVKELGLTENGSQLCIVAAAGNWGDDRPSWPAALPGVIAVAGLTVDGKPAEWSSYGDHVQFSAQAEGIVVPYVVGKETPGTDDPGDPYDEYPDRWDGPNPNALWIGTSFAAPQVGAELAHYLGENPGATCEDAVAWLKEQGEPAKGKQAKGYGICLPQLWRNRH